MKSDIYKNILVIVIGFLILYIILKIDTILYIAAGIGTLCSLVPRFAGWVSRIWMKLASILGWINSRIILTLVYFIFLTPIAFISKIFTKDPLKIKNQKTSLFTTRDHTYKKQDIENIW